MLFPPAPVPRPRISCAEFANLIDAHLRELEDRADAAPNHRVLLAVLRQQLAEQRPSIKAR